MWWRSSVPAGFAPQRWSEAAARTAQWCFWAVQGWALEPAKAVAMGWLPGLAAAAAAVAGLLAGPAPAAHHRCPLAVEALLGEWQERQARVRPAPRAGRHCRRQAAPTAAPGGPGLPSDGVWGVAGRGQPTTGLQRLTPTLQLTHRLCICDERNRLCLECCCAS